MVEPAERRLPKFVHAYLAAGTGIGQAMHKNQQALSEIELMPRFLRSRVTPDTSCSLFEGTMQPPLGLHLWGCNLYLAEWGEITSKSGGRSQNSYSLSTVAGADLETIGPIAGNMGWFQLH